jgi:hypothetical protein
MSRCDVLDAQGQGLERVQKKIINNIKEWEVMKKRRKI